MQYKMLYHYFICLMVCMFLPSTSHAGPIPEHKARAIFMWHLVKFVEWQQPPTPIEFCATGNDDAVNYLMYLSSKQKSSPIHVRPNVPTKQLLSCQILYISHSTKQHLHTILSQVKGHPILTISDIENFTLRGGMLEFEIIRKKVKLHANRTNIKEASISLKPSLLHLLDSH